MCCEHKVRLKIYEIEATRTTRVICFRQRSPLLKE